MKKKIMVTGGAGFIGSHLVEVLLLDNENEVHVIDCVSLEESKNLKNIKDAENLYYTKGDITNYETINNWFIKDADIIYHLASVVGIKYYLEDPLKLFDIVVGGTRTLIELCCKQKIKMVFSSTSEIYGKNRDIPWNESADRVLGSTNIDRWIYSSSKAICEHMLFAAHRQFKMPMTIIRFFNAYGPRQSPVFVISQSIYKAMRGESPLIYDSGNATRCFTYIDDAVAGLIKAGNSQHANGEIFNISNPEERSIKDAIGIILENVDNNIKAKPFNTINEYGNKYEDIERRVPDVTKAYNLLGFKAPTTLEEGINKTITWVSKNKWYLE